VILRKNCALVFSLKTLPAAIFYLWGVWRDLSYLKVFELGEHFPGIGDSSFLEIDGPAPELVVFQSTCSWAPLSSIWEEVRTGFPHAPGREDT
jgi:hypothetical protein